MFHKAFRLVFARCFTRLLYSVCVMRNRKGYCTALRGFYKAVTQLSQGVYKVFEGCLQGFHTFFSQCFYKALTMSFTRFLHCFGKDFTRFFNVFTRIVQGFQLFLIGFYKAFARPPQGVYNVCYKVFTRRLQSCLQGFYSVLYWIRSSLWMPWNQLEFFSLVVVLFILPDLFPTWDIYQKIPSKILASLTRLLDYIYIYSWKIPKRWGGDAQCHTTPYCVQHFGSMFEIL